MREILFRGKTYDGEWEEGSLHVEYGEMRQDGERDIDYRIMGMRGEVNYIIPETLGQYAGLKDKNDKRIFEGDIIKTHSGIVGRIAFGNHYDDEFGFCSNGWFFAGRDEAGDDCTLSLNDEWRGHIVIGNIHDNPELLEVK